MDRVVKIWLILKKMEDYAAVNKIYKLFFSTDPPARTCYASSDI